MKIHRELEQGTPEWRALRLGRMTASQVSKIITPTGKKAVGYDAEIARMISERAGWQEADSIPQTSWMERGSELEHEARPWFTVETGYACTQVGFVEVDEVFGFSPDAIVASGSPLEIKVPKPSTHVKWCMAGELPKEHRAQVHSEIIWMNAPHGYFMSYHPECEPLILKVERDDFTSDVRDLLGDFKKDFLTAAKRFIQE